jgi:hypothetical protein
MKYLVTVTVSHEFTTEISAKNEKMAEQKASFLWDKTFAVQIDGSQIGKFEHVDENIEFNVEES